jgi:hypothetical protein
MPNRHPGFTEAMEALRFMIATRTRHGKQEARDFMDFSDREELAISTRTDMFHPKVHTFQADAFWWLGNFDAALRAFETALWLCSTEDRLSSVETLVHDISCDECMTSPLKGIRYKCKVCFDYNICYPCRHRPGHDHNANHEFLYIPRSLPKDTGRFMSSAVVGFPHSTLGIAY